MIRISCKRAPRTRSDAARRHRVASSFNICLPAPHTYACVCNGAADVVRSDPVSEITEVQDIQVCFVCVCVCVCVCVFLSLSLLLARACCEPCCCRPPMRQS